MKTSSMYNVRISYVEEIFLLCLFKDINMFIYLKLKNYCDNVISL